MAAKMRILKLIFFYMQKGTVSFFWDKLKGKARHINWVKGKTILERDHVLPLNVLQHRIMLRECLQKRWVRLLYVCSFQKRNFRGPN